MFKSKWGACALGVLLTASLLNAEKVYATDSCGDNTDVACNTPIEMSQSDLVKAAFEAITSNEASAVKIRNLRGLITKGLRASEARDDDGNSLISALLESARTCDPDPIQFLLGEGVPTDPKEHIGSTSVDKALLLSNREAKARDYCDSERYLKTVSACGREVTLLMQAGSTFTGGDQLVKSCYDRNANTTTTTTTSYLNPGMISTSSSSSSSYSIPSGPSCTTYTVPGAPGLTVCN